MGLCSDGVHSQLLSEGFLFSPVGKPVVDSHLSDQIRAKTLSFGGGDSSLKTLSSAGTDAQREKLLHTWFGLQFSGKVREGIMGFYLLHSSTKDSRSSLLGFFCRSYAWYRICCDAGPHLKRLRLIFLLEGSLLTSSPG